MKKLLCITMLTIISLVIAREPYGKKTEISDDELDRYVEQKVMKFFGNYHYQNKEIIINNAIRNCRSKLKYGSRTYTKAEVRREILNRIIGNLHEYFHSNFTEEAMRYEIVDYKQDQVRSSVYKQLGLSLDAFSMSHHSFKDGYKKYITENLTHNQLTEITRWKIRAMVAEAKNHRS